ncbi:hypothetical protein ACFPVT_05425 [Corynebacterium choanae]|uniref:Uncharacterized protein n=1 Tax=Corynebacterium choanae TaxID=1862358 RepID=A0A3G6J5X4_9CORY|nr:hypothetical protein [Corynebacterium choanae]AZA13501.1 hypothetical protein CCHOA_05500 [Corynebacterium choanae]
MSDASSAPQPIFHFTSDGTFATVDDVPVALIVTAQPDSFTEVFHTFDSREFEFSVDSGGRQWWGESLTVVAVPADAVPPRTLFGPHAVLGTVTPGPRQLPMHMPERLAGEVKALTDNHHWR